MQQTAFAQYVIAPNGNDGNDGITKPWATLGPISVILNNSIIPPSQTMANTLTVCFMSGTYYFNQTYNISGGGSSAHPITISPCAGQLLRLRLLTHPADFQ